MSPGELLQECRRREFDAREAAADSQRSADWKRSPEGQANHAQWIEPVEMTDADVRFYEADAAFYASMQRALAVVDAARILVHILPNQHLTAEWQALRESLAVMGPA